MLKTLEEEITLKRKRKNRLRMTYGSRSFACLRCSQSIILYESMCIPK